MDLLTIGEVAKELGLSVARVDQLDKEGKLAVASTVGKSGIRLFDPAEVQRLKEKRKRG